MNDAIRMQISAFVDGELPDSEADLLLRRMSQDAELRREAAEYLELGRVMRGESAVRGTGRLRKRISAALDDKAFDDRSTETAESPARLVRPLEGVADAASEPGYTVPRPIDDDLRQYLLSHGASSSELGANGMNARLVSLRMSEETLVEEVTEDDSGDESATEETDAGKPATQP